MILTLICFMVLNINNFIFHTEIKTKLNMTTDQQEKSPTVAMFKDLDADEEQEVTEIESLCMNCQENVSIKRS